MKKLVLVLVLLGVVLAGVAWWISRSRASAVTEDSFTYAPVEHGDLQDTVSATGMVRPKKVVAVGSPLSGEVVTIYHQINDVVEEGEPLLELDDAMAQLQLRQAREAVQAARAYTGQARAGVKAAQVGLDFQLKLQKQKVGFRTEVEKYQAQLDAAKEIVKVAQVKEKQAQTAVALAQLALDRMTVRVPVVTDAPGKLPSTRRRYTIIDRKVVLGQLVAPPASAQLFTLAEDLTHMQVHAQVAEGDIARVKKGLRATFTVSAYSDTDFHFKGQVVQRRPMPTNVQGAVYYDTVIDVANSLDPSTRELRLNPGMTAAVDVIVREHRGVWKVPTTALTFQLDEHYQNEAAQAKLARWQQRPDRDDWKPLWVWDRERKSPWPIFVRIGGLKHGQTGIKDSIFNEILEWEPGAEPKSSKDMPNVIINAPPVRKPGLFDQPTNLKLS